MGMLPGRLPRARVRSGSAQGRNRDGSPYRAILGPIAKRIEKKLSLQHSGNSRNAETGPKDGTTWIVTDGSVGMEAQGIAVAEAVGLPYSLKRVRVTGAMRLVPARLQIHLAPSRLLRSVTSNEPLAP